MRGAEILPAIRMYKQGFPEYLFHGEFRRKFRLLAPSSGNVPEQLPQSGVSITINGIEQAQEALDEARGVEEMLLQMDVDMMSYRIGLSQVGFFNFIKKKRNTLIVYFCEVIIWQVLASGDSCEFQCIFILLLWNRDILERYLKCVLCHTALIN